MESFLSAISALVGVLIGIGGTSWADRARWKREQNIRWDERRIDVYAEYAKAVKRVHSVALRIVRPEKPENLTRPLDREAATELLTAAQAQLTQAFELILLVSDQVTVRAALQWNNAVRSEAEFSRSHPDSAGSAE